MSNGIQIDPNDEAPSSRRWIDQRWVLDNVISSVGIDWDQPRSLYFNGACGIESNPDFASIRQGVKKFADIGPAFEAAARRRQAKAIAAEAGSSIGAITNANTGTFQITVPDSTESSDGGSYDTRTIEKDITAVMAVTFRVQ